MLYVFFRLEGTCGKGEGMKVEFEAIREFCDRVAEAYNPHKIILFGSYARGDGTENSDVDILVIMDFEGAWVDTATKIRMAIRRNFPLDLIVIRPELVYEPITLGNWVIAAAQTEGKIMFERLILTGVTYAIHADFLS